MNPLTNMRNVTKLSQRELDGREKTSWHDEYKDSAWIFVGGLPYDLTEGDILAVFSQYGEIVQVNLVRDKATGKSKGFTFICYENQKSTILAVDNFNGIKILGRSIRVDHVKDYKPPKDSDKLDDITRQLHAEGCAPEVMESKMKMMATIDAVPIKEEVEDRDLGLGTHSVLKGFKNSLTARIDQDEFESSERHQDKQKMSTSGERDERSSHREKRSKKRHHSKKSKKTKSRKDKKRKKHKRKSSSSESDSGSDSSSSSSSESEDESSSSEDDDSRKRRRHKKKSSR